MQIAFLKSGTVKNHFITRHLGKWDMTSSNRLVVVVILRQGLLYPRLAFTSIYS